MRTSAVYLGAFFLAVFILSIGGKALSSDMPGENPDALWDHITKVSPYDAWPQWPDHKGVQRGRAPHGPFHKVYVNEAMLSSERAPAKPGAIIVKASYSESMQLVAITVMYKIESYNPAAGDWFWVKYSPEGAARPFGTPKGCVGCHSARAANDYIFVHDLK